MRAFSFQQRPARPPSPRAALSAVALTAWAAVGASPATAQWPGEVEGRVVDASSGRPVAGAGVSLGPSASPSASGTTDGGGRFLLRGVEPGVHLLVAAHPGFVAVRRNVEVSPGRRASVTLALRPAPLALAGVDVRVSALPPEAHRIEPSAGATGSAGDLLRGAPEVVVSRRGGGGPQTVSVRGSGSREVLVLVDGVPLNDPVTGEADLSLVAAGSVAEIVVLPGARSATNGARAQGGVILIQTRAARDGVRFGLTGGSLGRVEGRIEAGGTVGGDATWAASALREEVEGSFDFGRPAEVGGGLGRRRNADRKRSTLAASLDAPMGTGRLRLRARAGRVDRGLPGRSFSPSPRARQDDRRGQVAAGWDGTLGSSRLDLDLHGGYQRDRVRDPRPPTGLPYDQSTRAWSAGLRGRLGLPLGGASLRAALDVRYQGVRGGGLAAEAPGSRADAGVSLGFEDAVEVAGTPVRATVTARVDRDGLEGRGVVSHDVAVSAAPRPGLSLHASHRSAFSPPTLADQYFRSGVGVEANPQLRGERVPAEIEVGVALAREGGGVTWSGALNAYRGHVRGMILWAPDFRFVWSPRNVDVRRRGLGARGEARVGVGGGRLTLAASWSHARVVYDRAGGDVQVRYRPRDTGRVGAAWRSPGVEVGLEGVYTGARYPVPARVNELPGFWSFGLEASTRLRVGGWGVEPSLRVERLLDSTASMIFGFPEPGRTVSFRVAVVTPAASPSSGPAGAVALPGAPSDAGDGAASRSRVPLPETP